MCTRSWEGRRELEEIKMGQWESCESVRNEPIWENGKCEVMQRMSFVICGVGGCFSRRVFILASLLGFIQTSTGMWCCRISDNLRKA